MLEFTGARIYTQGNDRTSELMPVHCEVELDIFSGMPNPRWTLTEAEADAFFRHLEALPRISPRELSGHLGYRGCIVLCTPGDDTHLIRIQKGTVHISQGETNVYADDEDRKLERWLLGTGRPHIENELFQIAERDSS